MTTTTRTRRSRPGSATAYAGVQPGIRPGLAWRYLAACAGTSDWPWLAPLGENQVTQAAREAAAKAICAACPVRVQCRTAALQAREPYGVWGGLTERERARLLRRSHHRTRQQP